MIRVRDTGKGIAPERLPHIFEAFERGELSMGDVEGGLGLGLALVRHLVELSGGQVEAHSEGPGAGTEFVIRLPACHAPSASEKPVEQATAPPSSETAGPAGVDCGRQRRFGGDARCESPDGGT